MSTKQETQKLIDLGFTLECGETTITRRKDWDNQLVGTTPVILKFNGKVVYDDIYSRGTGHFPELPEEPVIETEYVTLEDRKRYIEESREAIETIKRLHPDLKRYANNSNSWGPPLLKKLESDVKTQERKIKEKKYHNLSVANKNLEVAKLKLSTFRQYGRAVARCYEDKSIGEKADCLYSSHYHGAIDWYTSYITNQETKIKNHVDVTADHKEWEGKIVGMVIAGNNPQVADLVYATCMDATDDCFEDWCANFGYDEDSIKAHRIWDACCETHHKMKEAGITDEIREQIDVILEDY